MYFNERMRIPSTKTELGDLFMLAGDHCQIQVNMPPTKCEKSRKNSFAFFNILFTPLEGQNIKTTFSIAQQAFIPK